jgi:hypothetical protein
VVRQTYYYRNLEFAASIRAKFLIHISQAGQFLSRLICRASPTSGVWWIVALADGAFDCGAEFFAAFSHGVGFLCHRRLPIALNLLTPSWPRSFRAFDPGTERALSIAERLAS